MVRIHAASRPFGIIAFDRVSTWCFVEKGNTFVAVGSDLS